MSDSDTRPSGWTPPTPVMVQGPPPKATWESAAKEAIKELAKAEKSAANAITAKGAAEDALAQEKAAHLLTRQALATCQAATPPDCTAAVNAERARVLDAMVEALTEAAGSLR